MATLAQTLQSTLHFSNCVAGLAERMVCCGSSADSIINSMRELIVVSAASSCGLETDLENGRGPAFDRLILPPHGHMLREASLHQRPMGGARHHP